MTSHLAGDAAVEVFAILQASATFRPLIESNPELLAVLLRAAASVRTASDRARLIDAVTRATKASDRCVELLCQSGRVIENFAELSGDTSRAVEELGEVVKDLILSALPVLNPAGAPN